MDASERNRLLRLDEPTRRLFATDASEYQEMPLGAAFPRTEGDVARIVSLAHRFRVPLIPRAAGTSLAGQCVGNGLVVDVSRHLTEILEIDTATRRVRVQPGVIRNELNQALAPHGIHFGPETSTANRATIGGMVGNNSCGSNSIVYGSIRDHLVSARGYLADGSAVTFEALDRAAFEAKCAGPPDSLEARIYRAVRDLLADPGNRRAIRENYPRPSIPRRNTGYCLDLLMDAEVFDPASDKPFNLCKLIAGSEGTLFFGVEFTLACDPLPPPHAGLLCAHFETIDESLRATLAALPHNPSACELIDRHILECTRNSPEQSRNRDFVEGDPGAVLVVEIRRGSAEERDAVLKAVTEDLRAAGLGYAYPILCDEESNKVWELRRAGQGLMSNIKGDAKPREVVEDTAVDVRDLPAYIREFDALLQSKYKINTVYYAHAGSGELHTRPLFNLKTEEGLRTFRGVAADIAALVKKYRGSLSGEHGDGRLRGEFIPFMVGGRCYEMMRSVKEAFDPQHIFNPGKIIDTPPMDTHLRYLVGQAEPELPTVFDWSETGGMLAAAEKCNGSGDCRKTERAGGTMCPSFMATREERDTTRARANLLRHLITEGGADAFASDDLKDVLDLCLSCKGCKAECPSTVDMANLKAEFLQGYYDRNGVPLRSRMVAGFARLSRLASTAPWAWNALFGTPILRRVLNRLAGFHPDRTIPPLSQTTLRRWFRKHRPHANAGTRGSVWLFADEFTDAQDAAVGIKTVELLEALGYAVEIPPHRESGRAALSKGLLRRARGLAAANVAALAPLVSADRPLVGIEPSALLCFRDEYPVLLRSQAQDQARDLASNCLLVDEFIVREHDAGRLPRDAFTPAERIIRLHGHCQQKALIGLVPAKRALELPRGHKVRLIPSGCCGMAGSFGYEKEHYDLSMRIGELVLFPAVRDTPAGHTLCAPGTSCRHQIHDGTGRRALHPAEILHAVLAP
ncbi:MAG: FAD-binding protein [Opitutales bacterium]|nr:FAD-binding protein [Opitutales bacterium]